MFFLAPVAAYVSVAAVGTGWSPLVYLLGAIVIALAGSAVTRGLMRQLWIGQVALLGMIAGGAAAVGYFTARPDPARLFALLFNAPPPAGVVGLAGRVQWHDGQTAVLRFHVDGATLATILKTGEMRPSKYFAEVPAVAQASYVERAFYMSGVADPDWRRTITFQSARLYEFAPSRKGRRASESGTLLVNERGEAWGMYNWGS